MTKPIWVRILVLVASWLIIIALAWLALWLMSKHMTATYSVIPPIQIARASNSPGKGDTPIATTTTNQPQISDVSTTKNVSTTTSAQIQIDQLYVRFQAIVYGVNPDLAVCIVSHESQWVGTKIGKEDAPYGVSRGWWQINTYFHPEINFAFASSLSSSTQWALEKIKEGHISWWSTYDEYCKGIPVFL